jgi:hypothetical protein
VSEEWAFGYPIEVGAMLFTMVDPNPGYEKAYNRWYERDHFYGGCMIGPHMFAGSRWVATRKLKDLRFPAESPFAKPIDAGSYVAIYWVAKGREEAHFAGWASPQVQWLYSHGRGFPNRTHAHTALYDHVSTRYASDDPVPIELALDHGYKGIGVVVIEPAAGGTTEGLIRALEGGAESVLLGVDGVDNVSSWKLRQSNRPANAPAAPMLLGTDGGSPDRVVQLVFLERAPEECWDGFRKYAEAVNAGGAGKVTFATPFYKTIPGTDTYVDQLW